jgi:PEP-CTERM motif
MKIKALFLFIFLTGIMASASVVTFSYGDGSTLEVQGTLIGTFNGNVFTATSATGTYNGTPISLVSPGVDGAFIYDNWVYLPAAPQFLDLEGLVFNVAGLGDVNVCAGTGCAGFAGYTNISDFGGYQFTNLTHAEFSSTPEPSTLVMFGSGIIGLAGGLRRKMKL